MTKWWVKRDSKICKGTKSLFAAKDIPKDTRVIEYIGRRITKKQSDDLSDLEDETGLVYIFELNKRTDIDGNVPWNPARLINHSCDPNCETDIIQGKIWIISLRDIKKGEELSYDYNFNYSDDLQKCLCKAKNCRGIYGVGEDFWKKELQKRARKKKKLAEERKRKRAAKKAAATRKKNAKKRKR